MASRIDFVVEGAGASLGPLVIDWGLSDHSPISGVVWVGDLEGVVYTREVVDWGAVAFTVAYEGDVWYGELAGNTAYERLVDFRRHHLKQIRICSRSKRWWDSDLSDQVKAVQRARRWWALSGNRNVFYTEVSKMKCLVKENKDRCCRTFCEESGLQSP